MEKSLISIIVPVYKVEKYLDRCVKSILNQTYKDLEIILVDDGSPDTCGKICDDYAKSDKRIKVIHKQNGGLMAAWIDGVKKSTGEFIYFIDSDDWIEPESVENYAKILDKFSPDIIINDYFVTSESSKTAKSGLESIPEGFVDGEKFEKLREQILKREIYFEYFRWNKIIKKQFITDNLKFCNTDIRIFEDINIIFAVLHDIKNVYILKSPSYNYYVRPESMIRVPYNKKNIQNDELVLKAMLKILKEKKILDEKIISEQIFFFCKNSTDSILKDKSVNKKECLSLLQNSYIIKNEYSKIVPKNLNFVRAKTFKYVEKGQFTRLLMLRNLVRMIRRF